jgi:hypothetical protein
LDVSGSEMAVDAARTNGAHAAPARVKSKRRYLRPKIDKRNRVGRRISELKDTFTKAIEAQGRELTAVLQLRVQTAAEALGMAEDARQRLLRGEGNDRLESVMTAERLAERAVKALRLSDGPKREPLLVSYLAQHYARDDGGAR